MMNGDNLGRAMKAAIDGIANQSDHALLWKAIGNAIVSHIQENAEVPIGIEVTTSGTATAQTGKTTTVGSIT